MILKTLSFSNLDTKINNHKKEEYSNLRMQN